MQNLTDALNAGVSVAALISINANVAEHMQAKGVYVAECWRDGELVWSDRFENTVVTVGKNAQLDSSLAGSSFTVTGPFMGLISSASFSAISAADTMASHAGWLESGGANAPTMSSTRQTAAWSAASAGAKALSAALSFTMTGSGTLEGAFLVFGSGAVNTVGSTLGTLYSAGLFSGGTRAVISGDVVNVSYSVSL